MAPPKTYRNSRVNKMGDTRVNTTWSGARSSRWMLRPAIAKVSPIPSSARDPRWMATRLIPTPGPI